MYDFHDIEVEIEKSCEKDKEKYKEKEQRSSTALKQECQEILEADIDEALERLRILRDEYEETQPIERWLRLLIFQVLFVYLSDEQATMKQTELLAQIHLSEDIFTKHWKMYSPDFKAKQRKFTKLDTGFARDEVESNLVYVAMVHYLTMYADIPTKSFVDFFGKMGIVPALCANGYSYRMVFTQEKLLEAFQAGLKKPVKVYKEIKRFQNEIQKGKEKDNKKRALELAELNEWLIYQRKYQQEQMEEVERFAAAFYQASYFKPDYWSDKWISAEQEYEEYYGEYSSKRIYELDNTKGVREKLRKFCDLTKEEFQTLSKVYKKLEISFVDGGGEMLLQDEQVRQIILSKSWLLYLDVPKYIREQERFNFSTENYLRLASLLQQYRGNWILTWKNYIYKDDTADKKALFTKEETSEFIDVADIGEIFKEFQKVQETTKRKIYVFKFRASSRTAPDSMVFITNIDFKEITTEKFAKTYGLELSGEFYKQEFDEFYRTTWKWTSGNYKKG